MYNKALEVLTKFYEHGFTSYIVGGYPRDTLLGINSSDIDICTDANPKEIMDIFATDGVTDIKYGFVKVIYKNFEFDVTTFRKEIKYENNRQPVKIKYIHDIKKDLLRRDFTINTICIDKDGKYHDFLGIMNDINNQVIRTVGNPRYRLKEDSLRILRAIRFASNLDFTIDPKTVVYIKKYRYLLHNLSSSRKKEELDKIFSSSNLSYARELLITYGLDKELGLLNLKDIVLCRDIIGIWSQLELSINYPFTKVERDSIKKIKSLLHEELTPDNIYKHGLYISSVVASIKGVSSKKINDIYLNLPIKNIKDIDIKAMDIANSLNRSPGNYLKGIYQDLEQKIINHELDNQKTSILEYIRRQYGNT